MIVYILNWLNMAGKNFVNKYWKNKLVKLLEIAQNTTFKYVVFKTKINITTEEWASFAATVSSYLNTPEKTLFELLQTVKNTDYEDKQKSMF
jgi:hypothetical protein